MTIVVTVFDFSEELITWVQTQ